MWFITCRDETVAEKGKKSRKGNLGSLFFFLLWIDKDWTVILITLSMPFFFLFFSLSLSCWVIQQDAGNYSHLGGQQERRDDVWSVRAWQGRQLNAIRDIRILKAAPPLFLLSSASLPYSSLSLPLSVFLVGMLQERIINMQPRFSWNEGNGRGAKWFTYVDQRAASCQHSWLKFLGPRMQGVMYDEQVVWV